LGLFVLSAAALFTVERNPVDKDRVRRLDTGVLVDQNVVEETGTEVEGVESVHEHAG
jgi:hypothetical protein